MPIEGPSTWSIVQYSTNIISLDNLADYETKKNFACSKYLWKYNNISSGKVSQNNTKEIASLVCFYQIMHNKASNKYQRGGRGLEGRKMRLLSLPSAPDQKEKVWQFSKI